MPSIPLTALRHFAHRTFLGVWTRGGMTRSHVKEHSIVFPDEKNSSLPFKECALIRIQRINFFQFYCSAAINVTTNDRQRVIIHFFVWRKQNPRPRHLHQTSVRLSASSVVCCCSRFDPQISLLLGNLNRINKTAETTCVLILLITSVAVAYVCLRRRELKKFIISSLYI